LPEASHDFDVTNAVDDLRHLVAKVDDTTLKVWDLKTERMLATLVGHVLRVNVVTPEAATRSRLR